MSYTSENTISNPSKLPAVLDIINTLGYFRVRDGLTIENRVGSFFWQDDNDYKSWTGVELDVYRTKTLIKIHTRTRVSRSYWDLTHQNKTITLLRTLFGGNFTTDEGRNRLMRTRSLPPPPISSGCYLARWRFHNAMIATHLYIDSRNFNPQTARNKPSGFYFLDQMNPRLLSNNILVPYVLAIWEEYLRASYTACLKYADKREAVLKKARLSHAQLEQIASNQFGIERAIAECFSFQRPGLIGDAFLLLDRKLDLAAVLRKPHMRRKRTLYDSIEELVEHRNALVHQGTLDLKLFDREISRVIDDIVVSVDRIYAALGDRFGFEPITQFGVTRRRHSKTKVDPQKSERKEAAEAD